MVKIVTVRRKIGRKVRGHNCTDFDKGTKMIVGSQARMDKCPSFIVGVNL